MVICAVIGCGLMGCKIAGDLALHGHRVRMYDSDVVILNSVCERMKEDKRELLKESLLTNTVFPGSVVCMSVLEECVNNADLIFEVVPDDLEVKVDVLESIAKVAPISAVVCTNSLRLSVEKLAESVQNPERFIGLRFLFPVYFVPEVEITLAGSTTSTATLSTVRTILESMGKTLFFRSGKEPLILTEEQRQHRWDVARSELLWTDGLSQSVSTLPDLGPLSSPAIGGPPDLSVSYNGGGSSSTECAICMDRVRDCILEPCRHLVLCRPCAAPLLARADFCPLCRAPIRSIADVYLS